MSRAPQRHRPWSATIKKLRLVRSDLFANAWAGELGHPGEKRGAVKKSLFCHGIEVDLATSLGQFLAPHKVSAFVDEGSGHQTVDPQALDAELLNLRSGLSMNSTSMEPMSAFTGTTYSARPAL
jgi:hypothetical protein